MANKVILSHAYCDDHMGECWQAFDEATLKTRCVDYSTEKKRLEISGYIYTGWHAGQPTWSLRKSAPLALPLDWQMAIEERESVDVYQDW